MELIGSGCLLILSLLVSCVPFMSFHVWMVLNFALIVAMDFCWISSPFFFPRGLADFEIERKQHGLRLSNICYYEPFLQSWSIVTYVWSKITYLLQFSLNMRTKIKTVFGILNFWLTLTIQISFEGSYDIDLLQLFVEKGESDIRQDSIEAPTVKYQTTTY